MIPIIISIVSVLVGIGLVLWLAGFRIISNDKIAVVEK
jgi:hypothetical protein